MLKLDNKWAGYRSLRFVCRYLRVPITVINMETIKREKLPESVQKRIPRLYTSQRMSQGLVLLGEGRYCHIEGAFQERRSLLVRPDDVWVGGFSRAGTHWLAELTWLVTNNLDFDSALSKPFDERIHYYDYGPPLQFFEGLPSPRYIQTHLPPSLLPPKLLDTAKMVYIMRDPLDVVVSNYHFFKNHKDVLFSGDLKQYYEDFRDGYAIYTPYFTHVKEFLAERNNPNLLMLFYEDMKKDLPSAARQVAKFFGREYTEEQINRLSSHLEFSSMKKNKAVNRSDVLVDGEMVRKGEVGSWRKDFDEEMAEDAAKWIQDNLRDTEMITRYQ